LAFSPSGARIASSSADGTIRIWNTDTGEPLATLILAGSGEWLTITPEGFFSASSPSAGDMLSLVVRMDAYAISQFYQALHRPDLVREKLSGDPRGLVRKAAATVNLDAVLAGGAPPQVRIVAPHLGDQVSNARIMATAEIMTRDGGIGHIEWRVNGVTLGVQTLGGTPAAITRIERDLPLDEGENEIEVVAYNSSNLIASVPARVRVSAQAARARPSRLFVVAIGVNNYADPRFRLDYAVPDATAVSEALARAGEGLYQEVKVTLVRDEDVRRDKLGAVFAELATQARPSDVFVFYGGGHGKTVDGRYYFAPQDFRLDSDEVTKAAIDRAVVNQGISQEQWQVWFASVAAKRSILLFDTCESGTLTGEARESLDLERGAASDRLVQATGRTVLAAASGDSDALEGYRGHGLFTYHVLEALERADSDGNGVIEVAEFATYIYAQVKAVSTQVLRERQVPQVRITGTNYAFAKTTRVLDRAVPALKIASEPTHVVTRESELVVQPATATRRVRKLEPNSRVTAVNTEPGWVLVAKEGKTIGYIATRDLAPIR
jgi:uncharacterized caspase-like protein